MGQYFEKKRSLALGLAVSGMHKYPRRNFDLLLKNKSIDIYQKYHINGFLLQMVHVPTGNFCFRYWNGNFYLPPNNKIAQRDVWLERMYFGDSRN